MTPQQRIDLIRACDNGDDVHIVTLAMAIAATAARGGSMENALAIRAMADAHLRMEQTEIEYRRLRLEIAAQMLAPVWFVDRGMTAEAEVAAALTGAEMLIAQNATRPVPA